jgi:hypothetical protein
LQSFVYNPAAITDEMANTAFDISQLPRQKEVMLNILRTQANIFGVKKNIFEHEFKRIQEIKIPILLIWGKQDPVIRFSDSEIALKMLPQAKLYTFDPCGHLPQIEYIDEFNQVVDGFCSNTNQASIVSLEDFNSLQETSYLLKNSNNAKRLYAAVDETEALIAKSTKKRKNRESCLYRTSKKRPTILAKK